jgi:hypothetical protein
MDTGEKTERGRCSECFFVLANGKCTVLLGRIVGFENGVSVRRVKKKRQDREDGAGGGGAYLG